MPDPSLDERGGAASRPGNSDTRRSAKTAASRPEIAWRWSVDAAVEAEEAELQATVGLVVRSLEAEFGAGVVAQALQNVDVTVHVYAEPNDLAGPGLALLELYDGFGGPVADVHVLAPSRHGSARTMVGEPQDARYMHRVLMHELSTIVLVQLTEAKRQGWTFYEGPGWFCQGYPEYLGLTRTTEHARTTTLALYTERARGDARQLDRDYLGGALKLAYLHEVAGQAAVHRLLLSEHPTFATAYVEATGQEVDDLDADVRAWLDGLPRANPRSRRAPAND